MHCGWHVFGTVIDGSWMRSTSISRLWWSLMRASMPALDFIMFKSRIRRLFYSMVRRAHWQASGTVFTTALQAACSDARWASCSFMLTAARASTLVSHYLVRSRSARPPVSCRKSSHTPHPAVYIDRSPLTKLGPQCMNRIDVLPMAKP
jgi:hypothetical protein